MNCIKWQKGGGVKQQVQNPYWIFLKPKNWSRGWGWLGQRMSLALNYRYLVCRTAAVPVRYCVVLVELCSGDHEGHKQLLQIQRGSIWILKCPFLCGIWMPPRQLWWNQLICNLKLRIFAFKVKIRCLNYWAGKKEKTKPNLEKFVRVWKCILFHKGNTLFPSLFSQTISQTSQLLSSWRDFFYYIFYFWSTTFYSTVPVHLLSWFQKARSRCCTWQK